MLVKYLLISIAFEYGELLSSLLTRGMYLGHMQPRAGVDMAQEVEVSLNLEGGHQSVNPGVSCAWTIFISRITKYKYQKP